eukprot:2900684-Rhodomonas_salina.2
MFEGKRATNTAAFPGAIGYEPPKTYDDQGRMMDYSSVKEGGPFGTFCFELFCCGVTDGVMWLMLVRRGRRAVAVKLVSVMVQRRAWGLGFRV